MIIILCTFVVITLGLFVASQIMAHNDQNIIQPPTFQVISNFLSLGMALTSALFSFLLIRQGDITRKNNDDVNARSEAFRTLQFIAANHTIVDFVDNMLLFRISERYTKRLRDTGDFKFYMRENGIAVAEVRENYDNYLFLTLKLPIRIVVGTAVRAIQFTNILMVRENTVHSFVPCSKSFHALILYNEDEKRQEASVNLIVDKDSEFYNEDITNPFTKIKVHVKMHSFLGVAVAGWMELYFTNPQKLERDGANKYKINSSQFQITGLPTLAEALESDISDQVN